ncbi:hypothetical protein [Embleya sp. NPDC020630]
MTAAEREAEAERERQEQAEKKAAADDRAARRAVADAQWSAHVRRSTRR